MQLKIKVSQCDVKMIMASSHLNVLLFAFLNPLGAYFMHFVNVCTIQRKFDRLKGNRKIDLQKRGTELLN